MVVFLARRARWPQSHQRSHHGTTVDASPQRLPLSTVPGRSWASGLLATSTELEHMFGRTEVRFLRAPRTKQADLSRTTREREGSRHGRIRTVDAVRGQGTDPHQRTELAGPW